MSDDKMYITAEGKADMEQELQRLKEGERPRLAEKLREAVAMGDLKENADYHDTREKMGLLEGRIQYLEAVLRDAEVVENSGPADEVRIGTTVTIREEGADEDEIYTIVGAAEANPREGKISQKSPIGAALMNRRKGDKVKVETPNGVVTFKIRKIE
jgi:transcription elongation factor GreA